MQFRLPQVSFFWTSVECQGAESRSKEDCSSQKNGFYLEMLTQWEVSQDLWIISTDSVHVLAELSEALSGEICRQDTEFELTKSVEVAFSKTKRENFQKHHSSILQPKEWGLHCKPMPSKKGTWSSDLTELETSHVLHRGALTGAEKNYQKLGEGMLSNNLGNGEISLLSLWQNSLHSRLTRSPLVPHICHVLPAISLARLFKFYSI